MVAAKGGKAVAGGSLARTGHLTGDATRLRVLGNVGFLSLSGMVHDSVYTDTRSETRYLLYSSSLVRIVEVDCTNLYTLG